MGSSVVHADSRPRQMDGTNAQRILDLAGSRNPWPIRNLSLIEEQQDKSRPQPLPSLKQMRYLGATHHFQATPGAKGSTRDTNSDHGTTRSIDSRNSRSRVRREEFGKPRLFCFRLRIVVAHANSGNHGNGGFVQRFPRSRVEEPHLSFLAHWRFQPGAVGRHSAATVSVRLAADLELFELSDRRSRNLPSRSKSASVRCRAGTGHQRQLFARSREPQLVQLGELALCAPCRLSGRERE
jgi:hypothetical protein